MVVEIFIIHRLRTAATALQAISFCFNWYCWSAGYCSAGCCHPAAHRPMPTSLPINLSGAQTAADLFFFFFFFEFYLFFIQQVLISYLFHTHQCIHVNANLPIHHTTTTPPPATFPPWCPPLVFFMAASELPIFNSQNPLDKGIISLLQPAGIPKAKI